MVKMHVVATEALYAVATTTIELATGCASHRGSFRSFGTSIKVVLGVLEHHRLQVRALWATIFLHFPHLLSFLAAPASTPGVPNACDDPASLRICEAAEGR